MLPSTGTILKALDGEKERLQEITDLDGWTTGTAPTYASSYASFAATGLTAAPSVQGYSPKVSTALATGALLTAAYLARREGDNIRMSTGREKSPNYDENTSPPI